MITKSPDDPWLALRHSLCHRF